MNPATFIIHLSPDKSATVPDDEYWLTIAQVTEDKNVTPGDVAEIVDTLFDLSPCVDPKTAPVSDAEPPSDPAEMVDKLEAAGLIDLESCERRLTGTYTAQLKVVRSHPNEPYTLRLSVGEIVETKIIAGLIVETVDVKSDTHIVLSNPVVSGLSCSWMGPVIGEFGQIDPPAIKVIGNTLFWAGTATGTIRAEYASIHDLVTVEIPGIPNYPGAELGQPQDSSALAFYHFQVYQCDITPPAEDQETTLAEVCGWLDEIGGDDDDEDEPLPEPPPPPEPVYGCIDYYPLAPAGSPVTEPWFYEQTCCVPGSHDGCRVRSSRREGGKGLSPEKIAQMTADWPGPIEFIGLGPVTPAGCGTRYEETKIIQQHCCDKVTPMAWDTATSVEVLTPGTSGIVGVTGGHPPYRWSVRGQGFTLDGRSLRDGETSTPYVRIYASSIACGPAPITVSDGCSSVNDIVRATVGKWAEIYPDMGVCPVRGDASHHIGDAVFEVVKGKYKLRQADASSYYGSNCGGFDLHLCASTYAFNPQNGAHYSCIANFYNIYDLNPNNVGGWNYVHDHCFYENFYVDGWACTQSRWAEHQKYFYEWVC